MDSKTMRQVAIGGALAALAGGAMTVLYSYFRGQVFLAAAQRGDTAAVQSYLRKGMPVTVDYHGITALELAAASGYLDTMRVLLAAGADANARNDYGLTPLHAAALAGHAEAVALLLEHGADPMAKDRQGRTPLALAEEKGQTQVLPLLEPREHDESERAG